MSELTPYDDSDPDLPLEGDMDADSDDLEADMACPSCGAAVIADAQKCPVCGDWIKPIHARSSGIPWRRWLFVAAVLLMLLAMLRFSI